LDQAATRALRDAGTPVRGDSTLLAAVEVPGGRVRWVLLSDALREEAFDSTHVLVVGKDSVVVLDVRDGTHGPMQPASGLIVPWSGLRLRVREDERIRAAANTITAEVETEPLLPAAARTLAPEPTEHRAPKPNQSLVAYDLASGAMRWRRPIANAGYFDVVQAPGGAAAVYVLTGKGLERLDARTGAGWCLPRTTFSKRNTQALAHSMMASALGMGLAGVTGVGFIGVAEPSTVHHLCSVPRVRDGLVYWVAGREAMACDMASGAVRWSANLAGDAGIQDLALHGSKLDVVHTGARIVDAKLEEAGSAGVVRLWAETGAVVGAWDAPQGQAVLECVAGESTYVLTGRALVRLDAGLHEQSRAAAAEGDEFVNVTRVDDVLIARTLRGVTAFDAGTLVARWSVPVDPPLVDRQVSRALSLQWKRLGPEEAFRAENARATLCDVPFATDGSWKPAARGAFLREALPMSADRGRGLIWVPGRSGITCLDAASGRERCVLPVGEGACTAMSAGSGVTGVVGRRAVIAWGE
jgi:hypothetical protein